MKRFVKPQSNAKKTLVLIAIAATMMVALDFANTRLLQWQANQEAEIEVPRTVEADETPKTVEPVDLPQPEAKKNEFAIIDKRTEMNPEPSAKEKVSKKLAQPKSTPSTIMRHDKTLKIAIIIDDIGMDRKRSKQIINIGTPLTLAFLPYAPGVKDMAQSAKDKDHELIIHMPMEAINGKVSTGPIALKDGMSAQEVDEQLTQAFEAFDDYVGLNNHMGSRVTQNKAILTRLMSALKSRSLYFVDSVTTPESIAYDTAYEAGVAVARRDVFLDHHDDITSVRKSLNKLEQTARRNGYAIGIGHPKTTTITALKEWLPTLQKRNIKLVKITDLVRTKPTEEILVEIEEAKSTSKYGPYLPAKLTTPSEALLIQPPFPPPVQ